MDKVLSADRIESLIRECMADDGEPTEGFVHSYVLNGAKVAGHRPELVRMMSELPVEFFDNGGGGWSALNLCMRADGSQWTGLQMAGEQLFALASKIDLAAFLLPRELWDALPGGMPYIVFKRSKFGEPVAA